MTPLDLPPTPSAPPAYPDREGRYITRAWLIRLLVAAIGVLLGSIGSDMRGDIRDLKQTERRVDVMQQQVSDNRERLKGIEAKLDELLKEVRK